MAGVAHFDPSGATASDGKVDDNALVDEVVRAGDEVRATRELRYDIRRQFPHMTMI